MMGHVPVNITVKARSGEMSRALETMEAAYARAQSLIEKLSEYELTSEISCLNRNAGKKFCGLSEETVKLLQIAQEIREKTGGAFDIRFPSPNLQGKQGLILLLVNEGKLANPQTKIGIASLAKGYILDQMAQIFESQNLEAIVDAGGDIRASGGPWKVAIQIPGRAYGENSKPFTIRNEALTTSGNYENERNIVDPKSSMPIERKGAVSVIAPQATLANALSTAFYVLGEQKSEEILQKFPGIEMIWLNPQGQITRYGRRTLTP